jgi:trimethylamine--corrinoid protein Co-methyltransferase
MSTAEIEGDFAPKTGIRRGTPVFCPLSESQVEAIHQATLEVLSRTGVTVSHPTAQTLLRDHGCTVDTANNRVRFPAELVTQCIDLCPSHYRVRARDPEQDWDLGNPDITYFIPSQGLNMLDIETWTPRRPTRKEFYDLITIVDALPTIHGNTCFPWYGFQKVPDCMALIESNAAKIRNTTKPQMEGGVLDNHRWNIEMARATGQDLINLTNPGAPLTLSDETIDKIVAFATDDIPFSICSGPVGGATGPATLAGLLVQNNAEFLAAAVVAQLTRAGTRVVHTLMAMVQDMRTGSPGFGQSANFLLDSAFHQIWRKLGVPTATVASGAWTLSKLIDFQAGIETSMGAAFSVLSGTSVIFFHGGLTQQKALHPVKTVLDDDVAAMIARYVRGIDVNEDTLAVDLIDSVGPIPGSFLTTAHTRKWWKKEQYVSRSSDYLAYELWTQAGSKTCLDHAQQRMEEILATHEPTPLTPEQEQAIEGILADARQYYRKKGQISDEEWRVYQEDLNSPDYPFA